MNNRRASASTLLQVAIIAVLTLAAAGNSLAFTPHNQTIFFTENTGQWDSHVRYRGAVGGATVWLVDDGVLYALSRSTGQRPDPIGDPRRALKTDPAEEAEHLLFGVKFLGSNPQLDIYGVSEKDFHYNYFLGNDPSRWKTSVLSYDTVVYHELYPGVDMKYYGDPDGIEYTFVVSPGADPSVIRLRYENVESVGVDSDGKLLLTTAWGTLDERLPEIYQEVNGKKVDVGGSYNLGADGSFGFDIGNKYDPSRALIIDPVLTYSSYLGGTGAQYPTDLKEDSEGNIVVFGHTRSLDYPITPDAYQTVFGGGVFDIFITKINRLTSEIVYSTFLGGGARDEEPKVVYGPAGEMYLTGRTYSEDFPMVNPFQNTLEGTDDSFILKLNSTCDTLLYSTYLGGSKEEDLARIALDDQGYIYLSGITTSSDYPIMNPYSGELNGGQYDGFITKLTPAGDALVYSTYLGGRLDEELWGIGVNQAGEAIVAGFTLSTDYPEVNPLQACQINPNALLDAIITKLSADGSSLVFSTYLGGTQDEWFEDLVLDDSGNVYLVGSMESWDYEWVNSFQPEHCPIDSGTKGSDAFVMCLSGAGDEVLFGGFLCGSQDDIGVSIDLGGDGSIYMAGVTESDDFTLASPIDGTFDGESDMVVARISPGGSHIVYCTYFGGDDDDYKANVAAGSDECVHFAGTTYSDDITMVNPTQPVSLADYDMFLATMCGGCCMGDRGNFDGDPLDQLDALDVVAMANWLFQGGPIAPCVDEGDVTGEGTLDLWDLLYLVNYMYRYGPAPASCD